MKHVIIVHGLYMHGVVMTFVEKRFKALGYQTHNFSYNSLNAIVASDNLANYINDNNLNGNVYFVGHSLGGIVIHNCLQNNLKFMDTCVVTLGTPHNGSSVAKKIVDFRLQSIFGKTKDLLINGITSDYNYELGAIIGNHNSGVGNMFSIPDGDGTVSLSEATPKKYTDMIVMDINHTNMVYSKDVVHQAHHFIQNRSFKTIDPD